MIPANRFDCWPNVGFVSDCCCCCWVLLAAGVENAPVLLPKSDVFAAVSGNFCCRDDVDPKTKGVADEAVVVTVWFDPNTNGLLDVVVVVVDDTLPKTGVIELFSDFVEVEPKANKLFGCCKLLLCSEELLLFEALLKPLPNILPLLVLLLCSFNWAEVFPPNVDEFDCTTLLPNIELVDAVVVIGTVDPNIGIFQSLLT